MHNKETSQADLINYLRIKLPQCWQFKVDGEKGDFTLTILKGNKILFIIDCATIEVISGIYSWNVFCNDNFIILSEIMTFKKLNNYEINLLQSYAQKSEKKIFVNTNYSIGEFVMANCLLEDPRQF